MAKQSLFSILLEQPWWISALAGVALFGITHVIFPPVAPFVALPFVMLAMFVGFRQLRSVSSNAVDARLEAVREMQWEAFSAAVSTGYRNQGYQVASATNSGFDFTLTKQGRVTLLQCRRWKAAQFGVGPIEELAAAITREEAYNGIYICAGGVSAKAREYAAKRPITLTTGTELATLVGPVGKPAKRWYEP
jgi:restriction system protein